MEAKISRRSQKKDTYVRALLVLRGLKHSELAEKAGVSRPFFSLVVRGERGGTKKPGPGVDAVRRTVATALDMKVEELWPTKKDQKENDAPLGMLIPAKRG